MDRQECLSYQQTDVFPRHLRGVKTAATVLRGLGAPVPLSGALPLENDL